MSTLLVNFHPELTRLGWALIHLLWQGLAVAVALEVALLLAGNGRSRLRYFLCGVALAALPVCFALTYGHLGRERPTSMPDPVPAMGALPGADATPASAPVVVDPLVENDVPQAATGTEPRASFLRDWNQLVPYITWVWLAGVMILGARKAGGLVVLARLRRNGVAEPDEPMMALFLRACARIGVDPRRVRLRISHLVRVPMTMGWLSPIVLFPAALASGLSTGEIELILAHELAHVRRWDYLVNLLQAVVETLFFYHPLTWWISRRMRQERENCCDDLVAEGPQEKLAYARTLLRLEELRVPGETLAAAATGGVLRRRIERLVSEPASGMAGGISVALVLLVTLGAGAAVSAAKAAVALPTIIPAAENKPAMTAAEAKEKGIAAVVNGKPIYWADMDDPAESYLKSKFTGNELQEKLAENRWGRRERAILRELCIQDAEASGYQVPQDVLDGRVAFGVKGFHGDKAAFERNLEKNGQTLEKFNERNRGDLLWSHELEVYVDDPSLAYLKALPGWNTMSEEEKMKLSTEENMKLENALFARLEAKAVIQRFDDHLGIAAIVDGQVITTAEAEQQWKSAEDNLRANYAGDELKARLAEIRKNILHSLVDRRLIIEDFKRKGGTIPKSFIDDRIQDVIWDDFGGNRTAFLKSLEEQGSSEEAERREIEANEIVSYSRNKFVLGKVWDYYQAHVDQFPQDEWVNVTVLEIQGKQAVPPGQVNDFAAENNPQADEARRELQQLRSGADAATFPMPDGLERRFVGTPIWVTDNHPPLGVPAWWPFKWSDIEKLKPGETSGIAVTDYAYAKGDGPDENRHAYWILRVNERRPATVAATPKMVNQEKVLLDAQEKQIQAAWLAPLRARAKVQFFDPHLAIDPWATEPPRAAPVNQSGPRAFEVPDTQPRHENVTWAQRAPAPLTLNQWPAPHASAAPVAPSTRVAATYGERPRSGQIPIQQKYISDEMTRLTALMQLSPKQTETLRSAMEAMVRGTATKTVDQTLKEILSPQQEAVWEEVKQGARLTVAGESAANETGRIAGVCALNEAQKKQVFDVLYAIELKYPDWAHSSAEMADLLARKLEDKKAALTKILTPRQALIYEQQAREDYQHIMAGADTAGRPLGMTRLDVGSPPVLKDFTPVPAPLPLNQLPDASLSLAMPELQASNFAPSGGTYSGGTTVAEPGAVK